MAYTLNGKDLQTAFGIIVRPGGSDGFLALPKPKPFYKHDWQDGHGVEINPLEPVVYEARSVQVPMTITAASEVAFWQGYTGFIQELSKPGVQTLYIQQLKRSFGVKLENFTALNRLSRIVSPAQPIVANFTVTFLEPAPNLFVEMPSEPGQVPSDQLPYFWGYSASPVHGTDYGNLAYQFTGNRGRTGPVLNFTQAGNYQYLFIATELTAPVFRDWTNTDKNYGKFPDQVFYAPIEHNGKRIYLSRVPVLLERDNTSLRLS